MDETIHKLAILYADVSGSTHIYEKYGDKIARENTEKCLSLLSKVASDFDGRTVKTIGDEVMCAFPNPMKCALAAQEMQEALAEAGKKGEFNIGPLHVKIGWHYGEVKYRGDEIVGEAPITAQQIIKLAKADEILTSEHSLDSLSEDIKQNTRLIDTVEAEAGTGELNVYNFVWEEENGEVTRIGTLSPETTDDSLHKALLLDYQGKQIRLDAEHTHCRIGREEHNDLCIHGKYTSKLHAEIIFQHGIFHLKDISTNGTAIYYADGRSLRLHREEEVLTGQGSIYFGGTPANDPEAEVKFICEKI